MSKYTKICRNLIFDSGISCHCYTSVTRVLALARDISFTCAAIPHALVRGCGLGLGYQGSIFGRDRVIFMFSTTSTLRLTTHLRLLPRLRMVELYLHSLIRLRDVVLNWDNFTFHTSIDSMAHHFITNRHRMLSPLR
jgi:hypothetical protein